MSFNGRAPAPNQSWRFSFAAPNFLSKELVCIDAGPGLTSVFRRGGFLGVFFVRKVAAFPLAGRTALDHETGLPVD
jgi:hypothetical protein